MNARILTKQAFPVLKSSLRKWFERDPIGNSSAIAYCTIFSLPGLLLIVINVAGYFYDKGEVTNKILNSIWHVPPPERQNFLREVLPGAILLCCPDEENRPNDKEGK